MRRLRRDADPRAFRDEVQNGTRRVAEAALRAENGDRNPLRGLQLPKEPSPRLPMLTDARFEAFRNAAAAMSPRAERFTILAWYTGHRSASIRQLRWSDVDLEGARIHWRGEKDKIGHDHWNHLHPVVLAALKAERACA